MDDESNQPPSQYPLSGSGPKLSKTPSWVMLGFVLGALFIYAMMRRDEPVAAVPVRFVEAPKAVPPRRPMLLTTIEAVFSVWGEHAKWTEDRTEVALWNKEERKFSDLYEVRRIAGGFYFRSIPELSRRIIRHGKELSGSPLQFTETEEEYREWLEHGRTERRAEIEPARTPLRVTPTAPADPVPRGP